MKRILVSIAVLVMLLVVSVSAFGATSSTPLRAGNSVVLTCPNALTNTNVQAKSETVNCAKKAVTPPTTTTTVPVTTTTVPITTTTTMPVSGAQVSSADKGEFFYPAEPYITGVKPDTDCDSSCYSTVGNDVWTGEVPPQYSQTLYAFNPGDWYVTANTNSHFGGVIAFPNTGFDMPINPVDSYSSLTSSWNVTIPTDNTKTAGWATYDLWFNNWANEVQIHVDQVANSDYNCTSVASLTVSGEPWHLCVFGSEDVWKMGTSDAAPINEPAGTVNVQAFLTWEEANGYLPKASTWTAGSFGFEITDTEGTTQTFKVNNFTWDATS